MSDLLESGAKWLATVRGQSLSRQISYTRGNDSVTLAAAIGRTVYEISDDYGAITRYESRDFIIKTTDLVLNSVQITPERGDKITEVQDNVSYVYEVLSPKGQPHWDTDNYREGMRIHTKLVA